MYKCSVRTRARYNPKMLWSTRAGADPYRLQLRNAVREVLHLSVLDAASFGTSSMRCGGDSFLLHLGIPADDRRDIGFWATDAAERQYHRESAIQRGRSLLRRGITYLGGD